MVPSAPSNRLAELMDQIRNEFETQAGRAGEYEHQRTYTHETFGMIVTGIESLLVPPNPQAWTNWLTSMTPASDEPDARDGIGPTKSLCARADSNGAQAKVRLTSRQASIPRDSIVSEADVRIHFQI